MSTGKKLLALDLPPGPAFLQAWDRAWADGHAVLPLRPGLPQAERDRLLAAFRPHAVVAADGARELAGAMPVDARTDLVVATSGSTGAPKGVELSRAAVEASAGASLARLGASAADRWLCCLPLEHLAGLQVVLRARLAGAPLVVHERFEAARVAAEPDVAFLSLVPTMLTRLLDLGADLRRHRAILLGGAAAPPLLLARAADAGAHAVVTYGMTETAGGCVYDGVPLDGVDVAVGEAGRIRLRGPMLFHGYRGDAEATARVLRDGWFTTSDVGEWRDGRLTVRGRVDDVVVTGGENVSLAEVEALLATHPAIAEVAAFALPDPEWGQVIGAGVVPRQGVAAPTLEELRAHVRDVAAAHKAPRRLLVLASLPRGGLGKVDRAALARLASSG